MKAASEVKILVVDDEPNIVTSLKFLLTKEGYDVASATNGEEAIAIFQDFAPSIILLDVMMPVMDGIETAKIIRSYDTESACKIIFLTAKGTTQDRREGYRSGAEEYLVKPFDNQELLEKIEEMS